MTSDTKKWSAPKERVSRHNAEEALIAAVIELVDTTPIADITIHQLAEVAGVNFGYINRYFESRLNLFAAATDVLADLGIQGLTSTVAARTVPQRGKSKDLAPIDLDATRQAVMPIGVKRLQIVQFLVMSGVPTERFVKKSQEVMAASIQAITEAGVEPELARAHTIHGIALLWSAATLGPVLGLSLQELNDAYTALSDDVSANKKTSR